MGNPLDLNNLPDDFTRDNGKRPLDDDSSSSASRIFGKKKNGGKDESEKVYECRFCSLKFCKSQALGGHMNRHRQERETEALNHARELVFSNDNLLPSFRHQLGGQPMVHGGFHHQAISNMDSTLYTTKPFPNTSITMLPHPPPPPPLSHMYTSPASHLNNHPYSSPYPPSLPQSEYFIGLVCSSNPPPFSLNNSNRPTRPPPDSANNYTCIGTPLGQSFTLAGRGSGGGKEKSPSPITRFHQDGF